MYIVDISRFSQLNATVNSSLTHSLLTTYVPYLDTCIHPFIPVSVKSIQQQAAAEMASDPNNASKTHKQTQKHK